MKKSKTNKIQKGELEKKPINTFKLIGFIALAILILYILITRLSYPFRKQELQNKVNNELSTLDFNSLYNQ